MATSMVVSLNMCQLPITMHVVFFKCSVVRSKDNELPHAWNNLMAWTKSKQNPQVSLLHYYNLILLFKKLINYIFELVIIG